MFQGWKYNVFPVSLDVLVKFTGPKKIFARDFVIVIVEIKGGSRLHFEEAVMGRENSWRGKWSPRGRGGGGHIDVAQVRGSDF